MANFTFTVGPTGRTYTTLQLAWAALPSTVPAGDVYTITMAAGLYTAGLDCLVGGKTITGNVIIKPEAGAAWYDVANTPYRYDNAIGVAVEASTSSKGIFHLVGNVAVEGIQIKGTGTGGSFGCIQYNSPSAGVKVSRCIIACDATNSIAFKQNGSGGGDVFNNLFYTTSTSAYIFYVADSNSNVINLTGNTIAAIGGANSGNWNTGSVGALLRVKDNAIFGFATSDTARISAANSNNNATDLASFPGTSNVLSLALANQFTNPTTTGTIDLRPKAGNGLQAGITNALIATDAYGATRAGTPTIGAAEYSVGGTTSVSSDLAAAYAVAAGVSSDLSGAYSIQAAGSVSSDLGGSYNVLVTVSSDLSGNYSTQTAVSADLAASYAVATSTGSFVTSGWFNNTTTAAYVSATVSYTWVSLGRIGSLTGKTLTEGTGTLSALGVLTATGLPVGPGFMLGAVLGAGAGSDFVFYEAGTVA